MSEDVTARDGAPMALEIRELVDDPELIRLTVDWHLPEFDPGGDVGMWLRAREHEARGDGVPNAWVAFVEDVPVGCVSLIAHNMDTHLELSPWLAALFVLPDHRGLGICSALVRTCEEEATALGTRTLYLFTSQAHDFYQRLGWVDLAEDHYEGERVTIMSRALQNSETVIRNQVSLGATDP